MESALGNPRKKFLDSEKPCFSKLGKSVVAGQKLEKGTTIALEHLKIKVSYLLTNSSDVFTNLFH
jgi:sialic acid synthase SpsE